MAAARAEMDGDHGGDAIVVSCQRLEAYGFGPCDCPAPERLTGHAALERLAAVSAGLESVVLGEDQITGQVRSAFAETKGDLRAASDVAIGAARALRAETQFDSHAGHLLDKALRLSTMPPGGTLLVLGAGAMGRLVAVRGRELGFTVTMGKTLLNWPSRVLPRSVERATGRPRICFANPHRLRPPIGDLACSL